MVGCARTFVVPCKRGGHILHTHTEGCCLDIGERGQAPGGRDLIVEIKAWAHLHPTGAPKPHRNIARRGATHGFGSTLEYGTRRVIGVVRPGAPKGDDEGPGPGTDRTDVKKEPLLRRFAPGRAVSDVQQGADHSSIEKSHHKESEENEEGAPGRVSLLRHAPSSHLREVEILWLGRAGG